ncbi:hypothetical protein KAW50_05435 [candidate division WOR-3 bacterium]|nr:hypothetical protein [candidate division WOR-3 bacterium]
MAKHYIPYKDAEFDKWFKNFAHKLPAIANAVGFPQQLVAQITAAYAEWKLVYQSNIELQSQARAGTETKKKTRTNNSKLIRTATKLLQAFPDVTDAQRELLDITVRDTTLTPLLPEYVMEIDPPLLKLDLQSGQVTIHFGVNPGNEKENAKPENISGVKLWYRVGGGEWKWLGYDTNSPYRHNINLGEALEYRAQWLDKKMRTGRFSMVAQATVS